MPRTAFYFIQSAMIGFMVSIFPFRSRVSFHEAFEGLELGEGKLSRPVLRGPGGRKAARLLGDVKSVQTTSPRTRLHSSSVLRRSAHALNPKLPHMMVQMLIHQRRPFHRSQRPEKEVRMLRACPRPTCCKAVNEFAQPLPLHHEVPFIAHH